MEPAPNPDRKLEKLIKYLPIFMISHALVTVPTFVISVALAYATFVQADATRKIQTSETWPMVSYETSNTNDAGEDIISFILTNDGVGPARLKALEFKYAEHTLKNPRQFLQLCCGDDPSKPVPFVSGSVSGTLRPGERHDFIRLPKTPQTAAIWERLNSERWKVRVKACYCSIFEECWVLDGAVEDLDPDPVKECPTGWTRFEERAAPQSAPIAAR